MALQGSGAISLSEIATEFGGTAPHALSEYYDAASGIPASGTIAFSDFHGTTAYAMGGGRGVFWSGHGSDTLDYVTISTTGNASDFGDEISNYSSVESMGCVSNGSRGVCFGGTVSGNGAVSPSPDGLTGGSNDPSS